MNDDAGLQMLASASNPPVTWADQLTAFGTVGAVALSLALAVYGAVVAWREKHKHQTLSLKAEQRAQAEQIHWWHELCPEHPLPWESDLSLVNAYESLGLDECWGEIVVVENTSTAPVHSVIINTPRYFLPEVTTFMRGDIGPRSRRTFHVSGFGASLIDPQFYSAGSVTFSDAQGRRWRREKSGTLTPSAAFIEDDAKNAEQTHWTLFHTLKNIGKESSWTSPANDHLRASIRWLSHAPDASNFVRKRYELRLLQRSDEIAFQLLQRLPSRHYGRKVATAWWKWRGGSISFDDLIGQPQVFFPHEALLLAQDRQSRQLPTP